MRTDEERRDDVTLALAITTLAFAAAMVIALIARSYEASTFFALVASVHGAANWWRMRRGATQ